MSSVHFYFTLVHERDKIKLFTVSSGGKRSAASPGKDETPGESRGLFHRISILRFFGGLFPRSAAVGTGFRPPQQQLVIAGSPAIKAFLIGATQRLGFHPSPPSKVQEVSEGLVNLSYKKGNFVI